MKPSNKTKETFFIKLTDSCGKKFVATLPEIIAVTAELAKETAELHAKTAALVALITKPQEK